MIKRILWGTTLCLFMMSIGLAIQEQEAHFRNTNWGMSTTQVKQLEDNDYLQDLKPGANTMGMSGLIYKGRVGDFDAMIAYYFIEDKLVQGRYIFQQKHVNKNLHIDDLVQIKNELIEKYGEPEKDDQLWKNNLYKDDPDDWGRAIGYGHMKYLSEWKIPGSILRMSLTGDNRRILHILNYESVEHQGLIEETAKKARSKIW